MIIINKNEGPKIPFEVSGTTITFDDELSLKLAKLQKDEPVHKDICYDEDGDLCVGAAAGRAYVAEIDIPAKEYIYHDIGEGEEPIQPTPVPLNMDEVTLTLWAIKE